MQIILDRPRELRFNANSLAWMEQALCDQGMDGTAVIRSMLSGESGVTSFRLIRALVWACLRSDDKAINLEDANALADSPEKLSELNEKCIGLMRQWLGAGNEDNGRPLSSGSTGSSSIASADTISG